MDEHSCHRSACSEERDAFAILCLVLSTRWSDLDISVLRYGVSENSDWQKLVATADRQGVMPILHWQLQGACPDLVPTAVLRQLKARFDQQALRNLGQTQELLRVMARLGGQGIAALPYKGPSLAISLYGNLALRDFFDLDILLDRRDLTRAADLLRNEGYRQEAELNGKELAEYLKSGCELVFHSETTGFTIELHWQIAPAVFGLPVDFQELWVRRSHVNISGPLPCLADEDLLLVLCIHAMKHSWSSLCWVVDIAELFRSRPELDFEQVFARAREIGAERIVLLGLALAHQLLSVQLPERVTEQVRGDRKLPLLIAHVMRALNSPRDAAFTFADHLFCIGTRDRRADKFAYVMRMLLTPDLAEWRAARLPAALFPLYRLVRMGRIASKLMGKGNMYRQVKASNR